MLVKVVRAHGEDARPTAQESASACAKSGSIASAAASRHWSGNRLVDGLIVRAVLLHCRCVSRLDMRTEARLDGRGGGGGVDVAGGMVAVVCE